MSFADAPVLARLRAARRAWSLCCAGEAVALGAAAAIVTLAAAALQGVDPGSAGALAAGALAGAAMSGGWLAERHRTPLEIAARVDRRLERDGAFATACEVALRDDRAGAVEPGASGASGRSLAALLLSREGAAVDGRAARRAARPSTAAIVAVPLLAGALLAGVVESGVRVAAGPGGFRLVRIRSEAAGRGPADEARSGVESEAESDLRRRLAAAANAGAVERRELRRDLEQRLARATDGEQARALADALRALSSQAGGAGATGADIDETALEAGERTSSPSGRGTDSGSAARADADEGDPTGGVPARGGERTMSRRPPSSGAPDAVRAAEGAALGRLRQRAVAATRGWPRRHDAVVERWLAARRTSADPDSETPR